MSKFQTAKKAIRVLGITNFLNENKKQIYCKLEQQHHELCDLMKKADNVECDECDMMFLTQNVPLISGIIHVGSNLNAFKNAIRWSKALLPNADPVYVLSALTFIYIVKDGYESWSLFCESDLKDPPSLLDILQKGKDPLSQHIREQFSLETKEQLLSISQPEELQRVLVDALNQLLQGPSFYDKQRFDHVVLAEETKKLIKERNNLQGEALIRLNRLLLEDAYPNEIRNKRDIWERILKRVEKLGV